MPIGHHISRCLGCGKEFITGDCIYTYCEDCREIYDNNGTCKTCKSSIGHYPNCPHGICFIKENNK